MPASACHKVSVLGSGAKISRKEISRKEKKIPTHPPSLFPPTRLFFSHITLFIDRTLIFFFKIFFFLNNPAPSEIYFFPLHDLLPFPRRSQHQNKKLTFSVSPSPPPTATNVG